MLKLLIKIFFNIFELPINKIIKFFNFLIIFRSGNAIGDQLLITGVSKMIKEKHNFRIILFVKYNDFFFNNPNIFKVIKINNNKFFDKIVIFILKNLTGERIKEFLPQKNNKDGKHFLINYNNNLHIAETHCKHFNLNLNFGDFKNEIFFTELELENFKNELNLPKKFSVIQSTSKKLYTKNKEWKIKGMQRIVNNFNNLNWVQVGVTGEPVLNNCTKLFDLDLRKLSYIIKISEFVICYEGLFNHIASCFNKKNFLIHTGFLPLSFSHYPNNIVIENNANMSCFPCYKFDCKDHNKSINENLSEEFVIKKINDNI